MSAHLGERLRSLAVVVAALAAAGAGAQSRPDETSMFDEGPAAADAGALAPGTVQVMPGAATPGAVELVPGGPDRDASQLGSGPIQNKFDTEEVKSDALKVGATLTLFGQGYFQEGRAFELGNFSAPMILDAYLDGRPNDRVRAFVLGRVQYDPARPPGTSSTPSFTLASQAGLTTATQSNPSVALDQLWLRFDIARAVYVTVGRQKVRWGVSRIWYPTDFLNSQPRDALNPFDARLGVNMVKLHVPVESLGWNFYGYGLLDSVTIDAIKGVSLNQLGGALRAELVLGPAELGLGAVWQKGRRPRYGVDLSSAVGPVDLYAEAAFRSSGDFQVFSYPDDLTADTAVARIRAITAHHPGYTADGVVVQVSGGLSWQFNYTDKNSAILGAEYFYNPVGYRDAIGYQVQTLAPAALGVTLDPIQSAPLYSGQHNLAVTLTSPGVPGADWITLTLSNIIIFNDPSALSRLDVIFRVLNYLSVQAFVGVLYGQAGGQLRFKMTPAEVDALAQFSGPFQAGPGATPKQIADQVETIRNNLVPLLYPPVVQAGLVLRLSI